jgi:hypothetical protein
VAGAPPVPFAAITEEDILTLCFLKLEFDPIPEARTHINLPMVKLIYYGGELISKRR